MAATSYSISRGAEGSKISDFTIGTSAPGTGDIELRVSTTDTHGKNLTRKDVQLALRAFERVFAGGGLITTTPIL